MTLFHEQQQMQSLRLAYNLSRITLALTIIQYLPLANAFGQQNHEAPKQSKPWTQLSSEGVTAHVSGKTLSLQLDAKAVTSKKAVIARLCAPIRSIQWKGHPEAELKILPTQQEWSFVWKAAPSDSPVIEVVFDSEPCLPPGCPMARPTGDSSIMLHAYQAKTFGEKLLFEPQWYKNTVGYWVVETDYAAWDLKIDQSGTYSVAMLQGCGKGQGGSDAVVTLRQNNDLKAELPFQTIDTGHFQNFRWNHLGTIDVMGTGQYELRIDAKRIAKVALFDVRAIHLVRQATGQE